MKGWLGVAVGLGLVTAAAGCGSDASTSSNRPTVVSAFYPLAWAAEQLGGDQIDVVDLTPLGSEPHDLELTPSQVAAIETADLVVVLGRGFQPAVEDAAADRESGSLDVLATLGIGSDDDLVDAHDHDGDDDHADETVLDPHIWLDPVRMIEVVELVAGELESVVDDDAALAANLAALVGELEQIDDEYRTALSSCRRRELVTSHDAFGRLAARYNLETIPIAGISPDAEPSPDRLAKLTELVTERGVTTVFTETLVSPEIAETLAEEAGGLTVATLNPIEGRTEAQVDDGTEFGALMRANLAALSGGLGCS